MLKNALAVLALVGVVGAIVGCGSTEPIRTPDTPVTATAMAPAVPVDASEVELVENVAKARIAYRTYLEALHEHYIRDAQYEKQKMADRELSDLKKVRQYVYLQVADLPPRTATKPTTKLAEADELYQDAQSYYEHLPLPGMYDPKKMRIALDKFNRIIKEYPQSDKVDDAFFYAAEILKEYFDENLQAVEYYKRAYEADPKTPHPARFQRAVILDFRLHQRDEALKEYRAVLEHESNWPYFWSKSNADFSAARIRELTGQ